MRGLEWLVRVGPSGVLAWAAAMGWGQRTAFKHAQRLQGEGWLARYPTVRGEGSLLVATRSGAAMTRLGLGAVRAPAPTWWAHLHACAWVAAWLTVRGRELQGPREVAADESWVGEVRWRDGRGARTAGHRPDLAWRRGERQRVAIEVELARKSGPRLDAILELHARWRAQGHTGGVIYIVEREATRERVIRRAEAQGLGLGAGLRVELLEAVRAQTLEAAAPGSTSE